MKRKWPFGLAALAFVLSGHGSCADETKTYDINGGFEQVTAYTRYEDQYRNWAKQGVVLADPFLCPKGWWPQGKYPDPLWKMDLITDEKEAHSGRNYVKLSGNLYYYSWPYSDVKVADNDEITARVWAKSPKAGSFAFRFYLYGYDQTGKQVPIYDDGATGGNFPVEQATPEWKQYTFRYTVPARDAVDRPGLRVRRVNPVLAGAETCFDDVELQIKRKEVESVKQ